MNDLPETILQFGTGKFLRAFADLFIHQANQAGQTVGRVVAVQSTGTGRAELINRQRGHYHVLVRGLSGGAVVDRAEECFSLSRALSAGNQWDAVRQLACSPQLRCLVSNTAEVGYTLDSTDRPDAPPPRSFPAKLLLLLKERFEAGLPGILILPCELHERNAELLRERVLELAEAWRLPAALTDWLGEVCDWRNTLVDRIVAGKPPAHPVYDADALLTVAEPFAFWAVETKPGRGNLLEHPAVHYAADIQPFFLRKVRILNAAHTALLAKALPRGMTTVRQAVLDPEIRDWLERLLFEEIVPVVAGRVEEPEAFARQTLERFENPFLEHKLSDIATYHEAKVNIRLMPTRAEFIEKFGRNPPLLDEAIAGGIV